MLASQTRGGRHTAPRHRLASHRRPGRDRGRRGCSSAVGCRRSSTSAGSRSTPCRWRTASWRCRGVDEARVLDARTADRFPSSPSTSCPRAGCWGRTPTPHPTRVSKMPVARSAPGLAPAGVSPSSKRSRPAVGRQSGECRHECDRDGTRVALVTGGSKRRARLTCGKHFSTWLSCRDLLLDGRRRTPSRPGRIYSQLKDRFHFPPWPTSPMRGRRSASSRTPPPAGTRIDVLVNNAGVACEGVIGLFGNDGSARSGGRPQPQGNFTLRGRPAA